MGHPQSPWDDPIIPIPNILEMLGAPCYPCLKSSSDSALGQALGLGTSNLDLGGKETKHLSDVKTRAVQL